MSLSNDPHSGIIGREVFTSLNHLIAKFSDYPLGEDNAPYDIESLRKSSIESHDHWIEIYNNIQYVDVYKDLKVSSDLNDHAEIKKSTEKLTSLDNSKLTYKKITVLIGSSKNDEDKLKYQRLEYIFFANTSNLYIEKLYQILKTIKKINREALATLEKFYSKNEKLEKTAYLKMIFRKLDQTERHYQFLTPIIQTGFNLIQGPLHLISVPFTILKPYFFQLSAQAIHRAWPNYLPFKVYDDYKKFLEDESLKVEEQKKLLMKYGLAQLEIISERKKLSCKALIRKINNDLGHLQIDDSTHKFEKVEEFNISPYLFCKFHKQILSFLTKPQNKDSLEARDIKTTFEKLSWFQKTMEIPIGLELRNHQLIIIPDPQKNLPSFTASLNATSTVYYCGPELWDIVQYNFAMKKIKEGVSEEGYIKIVGQDGEKQLIESFDSAIAALMQMKLSVETPHQDTDVSLREVWKRMIEKKLQNICKLGQALLSHLEKDFTNQIKVFPVQMLDSIKRLLSLQSPQKTLVDALSKLQLEIHLNIHDLKTAFEKIERRSFTVLTTALELYKKSPIYERPDIEKIAHFCDRSMTDLNKVLHLKLIIDFIYKRNLPANYLILKEASRDLWRDKDQSMLNSIVECYLEKEDDPDSPFLKLVLDHCQGAIKAWIESYHSTFDEDDALLREHLRNYFDKPTGQIKDSDEIILKKIQRWKIFTKIDSRMSKLRELEEVIGNSLDKLDIKNKSIYIHDHLGKILLELENDELKYVYAEKFLSFHLEQFPGTFHSQTIFLQEILPYKEVKEKIKNIAFNWAKEPSKIKNSDILDSILLCLDETQKNIILKSYEDYALNEIKKIHLETIKEIENHVIFTILPVTEGLKLEVDKILQDDLNKPVMSITSFCIGERFSSPKLQYLFRLKALNAFVKNKEPTEIDYHLQELKVSFSLSHLYFGHENLSVVLNEMDQLLNLWREGKLRDYQKKFLDHFFVATCTHDSTHPQPIIERYESLAARFDSLKNPFSREEGKQLEQIVKGEPLFAIDLLKKLKARYPELSCLNELIQCVEKGLIEALYKAQEKSVVGLATDLRVKFLNELDPHTNKQTLSFLLNNAQKLKDFTTVLEESFSGLYNAKLPKIERATSLINKLRTDNRYLYLPYLPVILKIQMRNLLDELTPYTSSETVGDLMTAFKTFLNTGDLDRLNDPLKKYQEWLAKQDG